MNGLVQALQAEFLKLRHSNIRWVTFIAFGLAPIMGGIFILILTRSDSMAQSGALALKAEAMNFGSDWNSYLGILTQAIGVGGILVFGFVASWVFGREYSDSTAKDLLALPISRASILHAKFITYSLWCLALTVSNLLIALVIGSVLQLDPISSVQLGVFAAEYSITTILTILIGTPIALFAIWGKGYLAPLGFVALTLVLAQIIAAIGFGTYFPWSIPGIYGGSAGEYKELLNLGSYIIVGLTSLGGYMATVAYWKHADQVK